MKVLICGSRDFDDFDDFIDGIIDSQYDITTVITGGAKGADTLAENFARDNAGHIELKIYKPDWNKHGKRAGILRNIEMVEACDAVLAYWDERSKGTKFTIEYARKLGKPVFIQRFGWALGG